MRAPDQPDPNPDELEPLRIRRRKRLRRRRILHGLPLTRRLSAGYVAAHPETPDGDAQAFARAIVALVDAAAADAADTSETRFGAVAEAAIRAALEGGPAPSPARLAAARAEVEAAIAGQERVRHLSAFLDVPVEALVGGLLDAGAAVAFPGGDRRLSGAA